MLRHQRRGAVIHIQARIERLESDGFFLPRRHLRVLSAAMAARHGVQVDRVDHLAVLGVEQGQLHRVAHLRAQHRAGHLPVEGPVGKTGAVIELARQFYRLHPVFQGLRRARADGVRHGGGIGRHADGRGIGAAHRRRRGRVQGQRGGLARFAGSAAGASGLRCSGFGQRGAGHFQLAFHADLAVAGDRAVIGERAGARDLEAHGGAAAVGAELGRGHIQFRDQQIVLGAFAAFQHEFHRVAYLGRQHGVDLALGVDEHHLAVDDIGLQFIALDCGGSGFGGGGGAGRQAGLSLHGQGHGQYADSGGNGAEGGSRFHQAFLGLVCRFGTLT
ncbi:hypothetical protein D3C72_1116490 [compost metagenome]